MLNKLKLKSEFARDVLTLMTGTTIAQAIPIAISPILTRIYTPEDFGVFALFVAIISILGSIANGRYELAIMLPKKDEDAINIMALGFIINVILSLFLLFIVFAFHDTILNLLNNKEISPWLYLIPISVFLMGCFNLLNYFNNRKKLYKDLAKANIFKSIAMAIVQLSLGFLKAGAFGLISGQIFSQIVSNTRLFLNIKRLNLFSKINKKQVVTVGRRYIDFLKYSTLSGFFNSLSFNLFSILLAKVFSLHILGFYNLVYKILTLPSILIGSSISQVYFQEATKQKKLYGNNKDIFIATLKKLLFISSIIYLPMYFYIKELIVFIFGKSWQISGEIAYTLIPLILVRFISSILSSTLTTYEKQISGLIINFILFFNIMVLFLISSYLKLDYLEFFNIYVIITSLFYCLFLFYYYYLAKGENNNENIF